MESLCYSCLHVREVVSGTGSTFLLCRLSQQDDRFPKYPPQPIGRCTGFARREMASRLFELKLTPGMFAICRLAPNQDVPGWAVGEIVSITRTPEELSIVCSQGAVPDHIRCESDWRCLRVVGPLEFSMTGVVASLTGALARADISVFVVSTFDTDLVLVKETDLDGAIAALKSVGHDVAS